MVWEGSSLQVVFQSPGMSMPRDVGANQARSCSCKRILLEEMLLEEVQQWMRERTMMGFGFAASPRIR